MSLKIIKTDVLIIGASASGLMCAIESGRRGRRVIVLDHANKVAKKILMSGGGRCNFTNYDIHPDHYISHNPHFCKSALSRFTQWDFIALIERHKIPYQARDLGKLFCQNRAKDIVNLLLDECAPFNIDIRLKCQIDAVKKEKNQFLIETSNGLYSADSLVIASGGLSIPKMCASPLGYQIAEQFGHHLWPTMAGLVPFTLQPKDKERLAPLSGIALNALVSNQRAQFHENILFTHRGLSGPAILQLSSYWRAGESIQINLLPDLNLSEWLQHARQESSQIKIKTVLSRILPKRLVTIFIDQAILDTPLQQLSKKQQQTIILNLQQWTIKPNNTEGYRTAEVTLGGVDCNEISSKTFQSNKTDNLYFIGEVLDVTGHLGGYNFQWAWSSGWCAGQVV